MFHGGCIFVDHASGYIQVWHQVTFRADETIKSKLLYKHDASNYVVYIQAYHTDNGVFTSKDVMDTLIEKDQHIQFSGAGTANQNGVAERGIQMVIQMAPTILIHSSMRIPKGNITAELCPIYIDHKVWLYNQMPREDSSMSTNELWIRSSLLTRKQILSTFHTWGAPTYVLEPKLYNGGSLILKQAPISCCAVLLEFINLHSNMVGISLNLHTQSISTQFHVFSDDMFTTAASAHNEYIAPKIWMNIITNPNVCPHVSLEKDTNPTLAGEWLSPEEVQEQEAKCPQCID